jgi:hypothetical protein
MRSPPLILLLAVLAGNCSASPDQVELVGHFSNITVTNDDDPHQVDGYSVHLYRTGTTLFGNLAAATGSLEPAQGRLFDIVFDPATKKLQFKAKYSSGSEPNGATARDSRELLIFSGIVQRHRLVGKIILKDGYRLEKRGTVEHVSMKRDRDSFKPESYLKWQGLSFLDQHW